MTIQKKSPGDRIRAMRLEKGWSQEQLADAAETTKATISKIERSVMRLTAGWIIRLSVALRVPPSSLFSNDMGMDQIRGVPLVGRIAAGNWREAIQDPQGYVAFTGAGLNAFAFTPEGDSMNKAFPEGAHLVIDPDDIALRDGKMYAFMNAEGETTIKYYHSEPARLVPASYNSAHQPVLLGSEPITVIGRAVGIIQTL